MLIYFVRHGETTYNASGRIQGQSNTSLSPRGERQSLAVAAALSKLNFDAIYSSPLERAMQTARPIAETLKLPIQTDPRLMEINAGVFQDLCWDEITLKYPNEARCWKSYDPDFVIPSGESRRQLMVRGQAVFEAIRDSGSQQAIVVAHGGLLSAALKGLLGVPAERNPFAFYNGSISIVGWTGDRFRLISFNQIDHLRAVDDDLVRHLGDL